jgi:superfamily I DNA/RNA helicase
MANGVPVRRAQEQAEPADWRRTKLLLTVLGNPHNDMSVLAMIRTDEGKDAAVAVKRDAAAKLCSVSEAVGWRYGRGESYDDADLHRHGVSFESRERVHAAVQELSRRGEWTIPDLLLHLAAQEGTRREEGDGVTCATIHSAKGREWRHVFVVGCEEGVLPSGKAGTPEQVEEERRLMYVAMTRAAETLTLTWCASRPQWRGANMPPGPPQAKEPSRFIREAGL